MASTSTKIGHGLAKVLGIKLDYRNETGDSTTRGESTFSVATSDSYVDAEPTSAEWLQSITPSGHDVLHYVHSLFPFTHWIGKYNLQWLIGDLIAGITIGAVVVPQGMAYAKLANLAPQFGLYTSFMGVLIYWFFATSKDITIGPVAVLSTITGELVTRISAKDKQYKPEEIASALAIIGGAIVTFLGLTRLGWIVDLISLVSICAFMTGSSINIAVGQFPSLMGLNGVVNSRDSTYLVIINSLKHLGSTKLDAAMGLTALTMLYLIRFGCNQMAKRQPNQKKLWFFVSTLRTVFVILLYTMISWLCNLHLKNHNSKLSPFAILGNVPRGFTDAHVPKIDKHLITLFAPELPLLVIVMLIEHISISKSFGRVNNYTINPSQELVAIGVTNLLGPFLGAYPATGSFSRTAIKSKAGVRTPFAGVITAIVVLLAIYALPAVFFYIPSASLSAVIIHAVLDLITPPNTVYQFWRVSPLEVIIFFAGVLVTIFTTIEYGIYVTVATSFALFFFRTFKAQGRFLGKVKIHSVIGDHYFQNDDTTKSGAETPVLNGGDDADKGARNVFLPINHGDGSNPSIRPENPAPGVFVFRFSEGYNYQNAGHYTDYMVEQIFKETQRTNPNAYKRPGDRPWNDPAPRRSKAAELDTRPTLKAVVLDFSAVNNVDVTSIQTLVDVRNQLDRYASPERVQWHFANINNRWTKRALVAAGFGYPTPEDEEGFRRWKPIFSVAEMGGFDSPAAAAEDEHNRRTQLSHVQDIEAAGRPSASTDHDSLRKQLASAKVSSSKIAIVQGLNRPFFHTDLTSAVQSALSNLHGSEATSEAEVMDYKA